MVSVEDYFEQLKSRKQTITDEKLLDVYKNAEGLLKKALITNQKKAAQKLMFHLETITKERELVKRGIDTFIYRDDIEEYIDSVENEVIKIIELERYEREIPDEIVEIIASTKDLFDQMYVVFTDYTGKAEKKAIRERKIEEKKKDPILFGTFQDAKESKVLVDRFYFLGDWEDEYCDLTLDKMVSHMKMSKGKNISHNISTPDSLNELRMEVETLLDNNDGTFRRNDQNVNKKKSFFRKIKTFLDK